MKIENGQVWKQPNFPHCSRIVLFAGLEKPFAMISVPRHGEPAMVCSGPEPEYQMLWTADELAAHFESFGYELTDNWLCLFDEAHLS